MPATPRSTRRLARLSTPVLVLAAGLAASGAALAGPATPVTGITGASAVVPAAFFGIGGPSAPEVVEMLYRRYGALRVLYVRPVGDIYQAELIDRSGYRLHYTIDAYDGRILERYIMGRNERPAPVPPGMVPGGQMMPDRMPPPPVEYQYRRDPGYPREAGLPPATAPVAPRTVAPMVPAPRAGAVQSAPLGEPPVAARPELRELDPQTRTVPHGLPSQASVPPAEAQPTDVAPAQRRPDTRKPATARVDPAPAPELPKPAPVKPEVVRPVAPPVTAVPSVAPTTTPAPREPARADVRPAVPSTAKIPEPLIDPRTGKPTVSVPVAPLDDAQKPTKPSGPMVPPATLD